MIRYHKKNNIETYNFLRLTITIQICWTHFCNLTYFGPSKIIKTLNFDFWNWIWKNQINRRKIEYWTILKYSKWSQAFTTGMFTILGKFPEKVSVVSHHKTSRKAPWFCVKNLNLLSKVKLSFLKKATKIWRNLQLDLTFKLKIFLEPAVFYHFCSCTHLVALYKRKG